MTLATTPFSAAPDPAALRARPHNRPARMLNVTMIVCCIVSAAVAITFLGLIIGYVVYRGLAGLNWDLITQLPGELGARTGLANGIQGTLTLIVLASVLGVPVGVACGVYLAEYSRGGWFSHTVRLVVDVLVGIPSILVGVLIYELIVMPFSQSAWAGAAALAFIMVPIVARTTEEMLQLVPQAYREASVGVGASRSQTLFRVVLPAARSGIITGIMLAIARVAGETAPLIFTILGSNRAVVTFSARAPFVHFDLNGYFPALTLQIYNNAGSGVDEWINQAWAGMLILISLILVLNLAVRYFARHKAS